MTDEQRAHEGMQEYAKEMDRIHLEESKILDKLKEKVSENLFNDIGQYLEDCDSTGQYEFTSIPPDDRNKQDEHYDHIKFSWVDQYCNGGYVGDDFAGWGWIQISEKEWFKFHYSM